MAKNPNVGIGKDSKDAYVFLEVENNLGTGSYFVLGDNWAPVTDKATKFNGATFPADKTDRCYTGGLFVYVGDSRLTRGPWRCSSTMPAMTCIRARRSTRSTPRTTVRRYNTINVKAYLAAASADEDMTTDTVKDEIVAKAKDWAQNN
ncbi:MAG: hypothetical protein ACLTKG_02475 [Collinsella intestinalis]